MRIYIVRHGQPVGADKGKRYLGMTDEPLSPEGRQQAAETAAKIAESLAGHVAGIVSSPLTRCRQTACVIREHVNCSGIETVQELHEIDLGIWDGRYVEEIRREFPEEYRARGRDLWNYRVPGAETFAEAGARFRAAFDRITENAAEDDMIIIVAHAGVMRSGLCLLTDCPVDEWMRRDIPYAAAFVLEIHDGCISDIRRI